MSRLFSIKVRRLKIGQRQDRSSILPSSAKPKTTESHCLSPPPTNYLSTMQLRRLCNCMVTSEASLTSGTKKEHKPKLFGPDILRWGGGLPRERVGTKKFGMSLEAQGNQTFGRDILGFCRDIPGVPEKFEKKGLCSILVPYNKQFGLYNQRRQVQRQVRSSQQTTRHTYFRDLLATRLCDQSSGIATVSLSRSCVLSLW